MILLLDSYSSGSDTLQHDLTHLFASQIWGKCKTKGRAVHVNHRYKLFH